MAYQPTTGAPLQTLGPQPPGATPVGGQSGSYVPQSGGITTGDRSPLDLIAGQDPTRVTAATQGQLPDAGDVNAVNAAMAEYQRAHDEWIRQQQAYSQAVRNDPWHAEEIIKAAQANPEPQKPDLGAIQNQSDRARLLGQGTAAYGPLISDLASASRGQGPSQALTQYGMAADAAARATLGDAASSKGTGGQRAAIFQAAMSKVAEQRQQAAAQAAAIGASEQNNARSAQIAALAGQTNVYGNQLYAGTQHQQDQNQDAVNNAIALNAKIQSDNAANATGLAKSVASTAGQVATHV